MDEKVIIKSEQYNNKKLKYLIIGVGVGILVLGLFLYLINFDDCREYIRWNGDIRHCSILDNMFDPFSFLSGFLIDLGILSTIICSVVAWYLCSYELTVTNKRIYGKTSFGKRVDLPMDSVSAVATTSLKGIAVASSSGKIVFNLLKNRDEIHNKLSELLIERQSKVPAQAQPTIIKEASQSNLDELKKLKDLLDMGVISQEEFEAKKKQLLGL